MPVGYARVSTLEQTLSLLEALTKASCTRIFEDTASGARTDRAGLDQALSFVRNHEDALVVWRLDRLGRSLKHLIEVMTALQEQGMGFRSLQEQIDTTTSGRQAALPRVRRPRRV